MVVPELAFVTSSKVTVEVLLVSTEPPSPMLKPKMEADPPEEEALWR